MADDVAALGFTVDSAPLKQVAINMDAVAASAKRLGITVEEQLARVKRAMNIPTMPPAQLPWSVPQLIEVEKKLNDVNVASRKLVTGMSAIGAASLESSRATQQLVAGMSAAGLAANSAAAANDNLSSKVGLARHEMINFSRQIQDVGVSLAGGQSPFLVLIQQGAQIQDVFTSSKGTFAGFFQQITAGLSAVITPARIAAAGLLGIAAAAVTAAMQWGDTQQKIKVALLGIGQASGATITDINRIGDSAATTFGLSNTEAREFATTLAATGKIAVSNIEPIVTIGKDVARIFGIDAKDAADKLAQVFSGDLARGAETLNQRLGSFDAATVKQIGNLQEQNKVMEAQALLTKRIAEGVKDVAAATTTSTKFWTGLGNIISNMWDKVGEAASRATGIGFTQGLDDQISETKKRITELEAVAARRSDVVNQNLGTTAALERERQKLVDLVKAYEQAGQAAQDAAQRRDSFANRQAVTNQLPEIDQKQNIDNDLIALQKFKAEVEATGGAMSAMLAAAGVTWEQLGQAIEIAANKAKTFQTSFQQAKEASDFAVRAATAVTPTQKAQLEFDKARSQANQQGRTETEALTLAQGAYTASIKASGQALGDAASARQLANTHNIEGAKLELDLVGKTVGQQAVLRANLQAKQQLEQAAQASHTSVNQAELKALEQQNKQLEGIVNQRDQLEKINSAVERFAGTFVNAMLDGATATQALSVSLDGLGRSLVQIASQDLAKSIGSGIKDMIGGVLGTAAGAFGGPLATAAVGVGVSLISRLFGGDDKGEQQAAQKAAAEAERQRVEREKVIAEAQIRAAEFTLRAAEAMEKSDFTNKLRRFDFDSQKAFDEESKRAGDLAIWQLVAARAAERTKLIADTIEAATNTLAGDPVSEIKNRLKEIDEAAIDLGNALIFSGMAAEEAATVVSEKLNAALDKLRGSFLDDLTRSVNSLAGGEWINQAADLAAKVQQMREDAASLGISTSLIDEFYIRSAAKIAEQNGLTGDSLAALEASLGFAPGALSRFADAIEETGRTALRTAQQLASAAASLSTRMVQATNDTSTLAGALAVFDAQAQQELEAERKAGGELLNQLEATLQAERNQIVTRFNNEALAEQQRAADEAFRIQAQANEAAIRAEEQAAAEKKRLFDDALKFLTSEARKIQDYITHLLAGSSSPLSPAARLASAQATFSAQKALALTGNRDALSGITGNAQDVLDSAKAQYGSSNAYQTIFNSTIADLQSLPAQVSPEQFIVNAIDAQTVELAQALVDGFDTIDTNTDGLITFDEMQTALSGMASDGDLYNMFTRLDTDASGNISRLEAISGATQSTSSSIGAVSSNTGSIATTSGSIANSNATISSNSGQLPGINTNTGNTTSGVGASNSLLNTANSTLNAVNTGTAWLQFIQSNTALSNNNESSIAGNTAVSANAAQYVLSWLPGQNHATGGLIHGPGTGMSDSIRANLSNGEYVVNAAATSWALPMLDAINYGHRFPSGGSNDNVADAIRELREDIAMLISVTGRGSMMVAEKVEVVAQNTKASTKAARREAA